jgi:hypothetical protein
MTIIRPLMALAALAFASTATHAFQEQQAAASAAKPSPAAVAPTVDVPAVGVADTGTGKGTAVRIPGLGTLGVIPKMDFGLELLYGVADASNPAKRPEAKNSDVDDVLIRGTIKHKF